MVSPMQNEGITDNRKAMIIVSYNDLSTPSENRMFIFWLFYQFTLSQHTVARWGVIFFYHGIWIFFIWKLCKKVVWTERLDLILFGAIISVILSYKISHSVNHLMFQFLWMTVSRDLWHKPTTFSTLVQTYIIHIVPSPIAASTYINMFRYLGDLGEPFSVLIMMFRFDYSVYSSLLHYFWNYPRIQIQ